MYVHCYILKRVHFYIHIARGLTVIVYIHLAFMESLGKSLVISLSFCSNLTHDITFLPSCRSHDITNDNYVFQRNYFTGAH